MPMMKLAMSHSAMMGAKVEEILAVPLAWAMKSTARIAMVMPTTVFWVMLGTPTDRPDTAVSTGREGGSKGDVQVRVM